MNTKIMATIIVAVLVSVVFVATESTTSSFFSDTDDTPIGLNTAKVSMDSVIKYDGNGVSITKTSDCGSYFHDVHEANIVESFFSDKDSTTIAGSIKNESSIDTLFYVSVKITAGTEIVADALTINGYSIPAIDQNQTEEFCVLYKVLEVGENVNDISFDISKTNNLKSEDRFKIMILYNMYQYNAMIEMPQMIFDLEESSENIIIDTAFFDLNINEYVPILITIPASLSNRGALLITPIKDSEVSNAIVFSLSFSGGNNGSFGDKVYIGIDIVTDSVIASTTCNGKSISLTSYSSSNGLYCTSYSVDSISKFVLHLTPIDGVFGGTTYAMVENGTLTITPGAENTEQQNGITWDSGAWREAVVYDSNGNAIAIGGYPYDVNSITKLVIEEGVTSIGSFTAKFPNLTGEVVIPASVTYIGQEAFQNCSGITKLTFASGGTEPLCIAPGAFKKLAIEELILPADRPEIHIHCWAFNECVSLKRVVIPDNVTTFSGWTHVDYCGMNYSNSPDSQIFAKCENLEKIEFGSQEVHDLFFNSPGNRTNINTIGNVSTEIQE